MKHQFDFGISQEDSNIELLSLDIKDGDNLLCVASAGEIPLNILAKKDIIIDAVDINLNQIYLSKLKLISSRLFEPIEAAGFLGFMKMDKRSRYKLFIKSSNLMNNDEKNFWVSHKKLIENGVINAGRFEKYLSRFRGLALYLIGENKLLRLMEFDSIADQQIFFDNNINTKSLKRLFDFIFNPMFYKNRAVSEQGFHNFDNTNKSDFFYNRFRNFCTSTCARENYYLQYFLFNRILYKEALPEYLSEQGMNCIRANLKNINFRNISYMNALEMSNEIKYNKFHLSNIGDWMSKTEYENLIRVIITKAVKPFKIFSRYLHCSNTIPESLQNNIKIDDDLESKLIIGDKFPFYNLISISSL